MKIYLTLLAFFVGTHAFTQEKWSLDRLHSSVLFSVEHLSVAEAIGSFEEFHVELETASKNFDKPDIKLTIATESINSGDEGRDKHLKNSDFFNVAEYPEITFTDASVFVDSDGNKKIKGNLSMHGVKKEVVFDYEFGGVKSSKGFGTRAGVKVWGEINRYDFGIDYNIEFEDGSEALGRQVKIECRLELILNEEDE